MPGPIGIARMQLAGGKQSNDGSGHFSCRLCGLQCSVLDELEPCAFCDRCKDAALDALSEYVVRTHRPKEAKPK